MESDPRVPYYDHEKCKGYTLHEQLFSESDGHGPTPGVLSTVPAELLEAKTLRPHIRDS